MKTDNTIKHHLTYAHLHQHAKEHSTQGLCISEFIDNSISSYLKSTQNKDNISLISDCRVNITIDDTNPNNYKLIIEDNAGGMNEEELISASKEYHMNNLKKGKELNQYGVGMKFAIFWFGENAKIWTKRKDGKEYFLDYEANKHDDNDEVEIKVHESTDNKISGNNGTIIEIENIRDYPTINRRLLSASGGNGSKLTDVIDTLKYRYCEYIQNGLVINFNKKTRDNPILENCGSINSANIDETTIFKTKSFSLKRICDIDDSSKCSDEKYTELKMKKADLEILKNEIINTNKEYEKLFRIIENNDDLVIEEEIMFNGKKLPIKLCFLAKSDKKYSGVAIKHCHRFIYHLPNKTSGERTGTLPFVIDQRHKDGIYRWLYAEVDLTDTDKYGIQPDKNKARLLWNDKEKEWDDQFKALVTKYESFIRNILQKITNNSKAIEAKRIEKGKKENKFLLNMNIDNDSQDIVIETKSDDLLNTIYTINDTKIFIRKDNMQEKFFEYKEISSDSYEITYNPDDEFMKPDYLDLNILKLISLLCLISNGKYKNNENILEIINNIIKGDNCD